MMDEQPQINTKLSKKEYDRLYYSEHKEERKESAKTWRKHNMEKSRVIHRKSSNRYYKENKDQLENKRLLKVYGLSKEDRDILFESQENKCAICKSNTSGKPGFSIDHNHKTGSIRGILCNTCNLILGQLNDDTSILESMLLYLKKYEN